MKITRCKILWFFVLLKCDIIYTLILGREYMKEIVFFDLDGTLLTDDKVVLQENKEAVKKAMEEGIDVVLCTGRQANAVKEFRRLVDTGKYMICTNGAEIVNLDTGEELFSSCIDKEIAKIIYNFGIENGIFMKIDTKYARYITDMSFALNAEYEFTEDENTFFENNKVLQISLGVKTKEDIELLEEKINKIPGIKVYNKYFNVLPSLDKALWYINVVNSSVSKGNAVNGLCRYLNVNLSDVVCFGDDLNDLSMIQIAGHGIAMGNAIDIVKENANEVIGNNNTPAIAEVLYRFIKENKKDKIEGNV